MAGAEGEKEEEKTPEFVEYIWKERGPWKMTKSELTEVYRGFFRRLIEENRDVVWLENLLHKIDTDMSKQKAIEWLERMLGVSWKSPEREAREMTLVEVMKRYDELDIEMRRLGRTPPSEMVAKLEGEVRRLQARLREALAREEAIKKKEALIREAEDLREALHRKEIEIAEYKRRIEELTKELEEARKAVPWERVLVPPARRRLTDEEARRLEERFRSFLLRELGRVPPNAMAELRAEMDAFRTLPFEEAVKAVEALGREIVARERAARIPGVRPPEVRPPAPAPPAAPPPSPPAFVPPRVPGPPEAPISPLPFPRRLASIEIRPFWDAFCSRILDMGLNPYDYTEHFESFRDAWFESWSSVLKAFDMMIEDVRAGRRPRKYLRPPPVAWKEYPRDPVLHLIATRRYMTMEDLIEGLESYGVYVSPEEVREIVKKEWVRRPRAAWLDVTPKDYLVRVLGIPAEDLPGY